VRNRDVKWGPSPIGASRPSGSCAGIGHGFTCATLRGYGTNGALALTYVAAILERQGTGARSAETRLMHHHLARRLGRSAVFLGVAAFPADGLGQMAFR
jgi:hypothetical protein